MIELWLKGIICSVSSIGILIQEKKQFLTGYINLYIHLSVIILGSKIKKLSATETNDSALDKIEYADSEFIIRIALMCQVFEMHIAYLYLK